MSRIQECREAPAIRGILTALMQLETVTPTLTLSLKGEGILQSPLQLPESYWN